MGAIGHFFYLLVTGEMFFQFGQIAGILFGLAISAL